VEVQLHHTFAKGQLPSYVSRLPPYFYHSILSRLMEKSLVKELLYPVLIHPYWSHLFSYQFVFRPAGSTTAALVYLLHQISQLLQDRHYVHSCIGFLQSI